MELRDYQKAAIAEFAEIWQHDKDAHILYQLPTGGGKTEVAAAVAQQFLERGERVTFIPHTQTLVGQTTRRFRGYGMDAKAGSDTGGIAVPRVWRNGKQPSGLVVVGIETWINRYKKGLASLDGLLIIDEVHITGGIARRQGYIADHHGALLALSATPRRTNRKEGFTDICQHLVTGPTAAQLIEWGYLAPYVLRSLADLNTPPKRKSETDDQYARRVWKDADGPTKATLTSRAVGHWVAYPQRQPDSKTIAFALTIDHAEELRRLFAERGVIAEVIKGTDNGRTRSEIMARFDTPNADGGSPILINVAMLREGFDVPGADILLSLRPTDSVSLYLQMIGRAMRPKDDGRKAQILDFVSNYLKHGLPDDSREWALEAADDSDSPPGIMPTIVCRGFVELDDAGYVASDTGYDNEGYEDSEPLPANCFPGKGDPQGCGAVNPAGVHACGDCGASFRKQCLATDNDGCGQLRSVKDWWGKYRKYRPGACDECCDLQRRDAMAKQAEQKEAQFAWIQAKSGNGWRLPLAPKQRIPGYYPAIWVGRGKGRRITATLLPFSGHPGDYANLQAAIESMDVRGPATEAALMRAAEGVLVKQYKANRAVASVLYGTLCPVCQARLRAVQYPTCYDCKGSKESPSNAPAKATGAPASNGRSDTPVTPKLLDVKPAPMVKAAVNAPVVSNGDSTDLCIKCQSEPRRQGYGMCVKCLLAAAKG